MKNTLLATTALAALGAVAVSGSAFAAEKIKISVGGYMEQWFGYTDNKNSVNPNTDAFDQQADGEIQFEGSTTLDNGLQIGINVQLEAQTDGDQIDEQYAFVTGSFGRIILGSENSASYLMHFGIPSQGVSIDSGDHADWIAGVDFPGTRTNGRGPDNDSEKVTYLTPRFSGFQAGASYVPELQQDRDAAVGVAGVRNDSYSIAVNYDNKFGNGLSLQASAGYQDFGKLGADQDFESYQFGLRLGFSGFTLAGTYGEEDRGVVVGGRETQLFANTQETIGLGASYAAGPFGVSLAYIGAERDNTQQQQDIFELGAKYKLGPGVEARGSILYAEGDNAAGAEITNGVAVVGGLQVGF